MIDFTENLDLFIAGEFGDKAIVESMTALTAEIWGIFDERYEPMLGGYGETDSFTTGRRITFKVKTTDTDGLMHGDRLDIKNRGYRIMAINPYGDGQMSELILKQS